MPTQFMSENPYKSPTTLAPQHDAAAVDKAERFPFRCAFGGACIGSAAGALSAALLKTAALIAVWLQGETLRRPPDYQQPLDLNWGLLEFLVPELVVSAIVGVLTGILAGVVVGGLLGTLALFLPPRAHRSFPWIAAPVGALVGILLGFAFGAFTSANGGLRLETIPVAGACIVGLLGLLAGLLLGRGIQQRLM
jgi:MFS family permease